MPDRLTPERLEFLALRDIAIKQLANLDALRAEVDALRRERDELAAALDLARKHLDWIANAEDVGNRLCGEIYEAKRSLADPAAILAARDARMKRAGAAEELRRLARRA